MPFQDVTCAVALGYALANRGMIRRVVGRARRRPSRHESTRSSCSGRSATSGPSRTGSDGSATSPRRRVSSPKRATSSRSASPSDAGSATRAAPGWHRPTWATWPSRRAIPPAPGSSSRRAPRPSAGAATCGATVRPSATSPASPSQRRICASLADRLEESVAVDRTVRRHRWLAWGLVQLAAVMRLDGHPERAVAMRTEALEIFRRLGDRQGEAACLALEVPTVTRRRPAARRRLAARPPRTAS